jgi:hypothetical protein
MEFIVLVVILIVGLSVQENVNVTWTGACGGNGGFSISWAAKKDGEAFKPDMNDPANGVPCDEYFEGKIPRKI